MLKSVSLGAKETLVLYGVTMGSYGMNATGITTTYDAGIDGNYCTIIMSQIAPK